MKDQVLRSIIVATKFTWYLVASLLGVSFLDHQKFFFSCFQWVGKCVSVKMTALYI